MITVDLTGRVLGGRYRIERRLGAGGFGVVYEGLQLDLGRRVAIKVLEEIDEESLGRFRDEAMLAAALVHPNVVAVNDLGGGENDEPPFIVMELLEGLPLSDLVARDGKLPVGRAQSIASQILAALEVAHGARIIHRDIKPSNIWVTSVDDRDHVKVLDFGIARMLDDTRRRTHTGSFIGTPSYMAPEVVVGGEASTRSDLFAVGVVLYRMLSGVAPFKQTESSALVTPPDLRTIRPEVPLPIATAVMRALAKNPDERFPSARDMRDAIRHRTPPPPRREKKGSSLPFAIALGGTLVAGAGAFGWLLARAPAPVRLGRPDFPSLAVDASAPTPPTSAHVDDAPPDAGGDAASKLRQCLCKDEYGEVLCSKRGKARCDCFSASGSILCASRTAPCVAYSRDLVAVDGDPCSGMTFGVDPKTDPPGTSSHPLDFEQGTLMHCHQCPEPEWRWGTQGAKCSGVARTIEPVPGTLFCK